MADLQALYQEIILDHNKNPRNFRVLPDADRVVDAYNPLCGDHYTLYVRLDGDRIADVTFQGSGCAISKASASVMSTVLKGKSIADAQKIFEVFHQLVRGEFKGERDLEHLGKIAAFAGVSEFPTRVKCAILAWHAVRGAVSANEQTVTTE